MDWERLGKRVVDVATKASTAAVQASKVVAHNVAQEIAGARSLLPYNLEGLITTSSTGWTVYRARSKEPHNATTHTHPAMVSAWILDKRTASKEQLDICKREMAALSKLKHPSLLKIVAPLEETRQQLVVLTELVTGSVQDILRGQDKLDELETKLGLLQTAEALEFLHTTAGLVHAGVCPSNIFVSAQEGVWKLGGLAFSAPLDYKQPGQHAFDYYDSTAIVPPLQYSSPEIVLGSGDASATADVFSLALVTVHLLTGQPLLHVYDVAGYQSRINSFALLDLTTIPISLQSTIRSMLSVTPDGRPPVATFIGSTFFSSDAGLRALRFLRTMASRDPSQKTAFLADLPRIAIGFNPRVLKQVVLPMLLPELRMKETQTAALTFMLEKVLPHQNDKEFVETMLSAIDTNLEHLTEPSLLVLVENTTTIAATAKSPPAAAFIPRALIQALTADSIALQQAALDSMVALAVNLDPAGLKKLLPVVAHVCAATTSSGVRVTAFKAMAAAVSRASPEEAEGMIDMAQRVLSVDKSPATIMSAVGLGEALANQVGYRFGCERVVPLLSPLLAVGQLNGTQFNTAMRVVRGILDKLESGRGGGGDGRSRGNTANNSSSGRQGGGQQQRTTAKVSTAKRNDELDYDWRVGSSNGNNTAGTTTSSFPSAIQQPSVAAHSSRPQQGTQQPMPTTAAGSGGGAYPDLDLSLLSMSSTSSRPAAPSSAQCNSGGQQPTGPIDFGDGFGDLLSAPAPTASTFGMNGGGMRGGGVSSSDADPFSLLAMTHSKNQQQPAPMKKNNAPGGFTESLI